MTLTIPQSPQQNFDSLRAAFWDAVVNKNRKRAEELLNEMETVARRIIHIPTEMKNDIIVAKAALRNWGKK